LLELFGGPGKSTHRTNFVRIIFGGVLLHLIVGMNAEFPFQLAAKEVGV
jgi:hypothetical protein